MRIYPSFKASKESTLLIGLLKSFGRKESFSLLFHIRDISIHSFYGGVGDSVKTRVQTRSEKMFTDPRSESRLLFKPFYLYQISQGSPEMERGGVFRAESRLFVEGLVQSFAEAN